MLQAVGPDGFETKSLFIIDFGRPFQIHFKIHALWIF